MVSVAADANGLESRVRYFVKRERARDAALSRLLDEVVPPAYLFGGVVRDLAVYGKRELSSREADVDIVCAAHGQASHAFFVGLEARKGIVKNRFGGFRIKTDRWKVDIWRAEDTWAFRHGKFHYESVESLLETTITNWEAVLFRLDGGPVMCRPGYFQDIQAGYLDVVFSDNPNPLGMYVRLVRACIDWPVLCLSRKARKVVREAVESHSFEDLKSYERHHYRRQFIDEDGYGRVTEAVFAKGTGDVHIRRRSSTGQLIP